MSEVTTYKPGTFNWTDMGTTDVGAAKRFYGEVLGWSFVDMPIGEGQVYSMAQVGGKDVAALSEQQKEMRDQGIPPHWLCYISVENVDAAAKKAGELGATVVAPAFDVLNAGRMAVIQDPTGAMVALWEPKSHIGAGRVGDPGAMCWHELMTHDTAKAESFYTQLFGWKSQTQDMGYMKYTMLMSSEQNGCGLMPISKEMGPIPPNWLIYFAVSDCDAAVERVKRLGGKLMGETMDIPEVGRMAIVQDPQGAVFAVIKLAERQKPS